MAVTAPSLEGRRTALELAKEGIDTTLVSDAAVFALMPRINKVILGVRAVLANGGLLTHTGGHVLTLAAKAHHVPVVALSGLYKFTPLYPSEDQDTFQELNPPEQVLPFDEMDRTDGGSVDVVVQNPAFDYVPPELVRGVWAMCCCEWLTDSMMRAGVAVHQQPGPVVPQLHLSRVVGDLPPGRLAGAERPAQHSQPAMKLRLAWRVCGCVLVGSVRHVHVRLVHELAAPHTAHRRRRRHLRQLRGPLPGQQD